MTTEAYNPALTNPALTPELLRQIYAGEAVREPRMEAAIRAAAQTGVFICPWCNNVNDGIVRAQSNGMGVESVAYFLELLFNPSCRDYCLCQLLVKTMQTGNEDDDTISDFTQFILPLIRYFLIRFVELARGGEYECDGIVILQDTRQPTRLYGEGYYKLSDHLMRNGTVPMAGGKRLCSMHYKGSVGDRWLETCLGQDECYQIFNFNAEETDRADDSTAATAERNADAEARAASARPASVARVLYRLSGDRQENYRLAEVALLPQTEDRALPAVSASGMTVYAIFNFNAEETDRAEEATGFDDQERIALVGSFDRGAREFRVTARRPLRRVAQFPLIDILRWNREACLHSIYERLGIVWRKSRCNHCVFDSEASKCTPAGIERKRQHPERTALSLLVEYHSLCLNERGTLYVKTSLRSIVMSTEQREALAIFERTLAGMEFSLLEVKRVFTQKGKAARSVVKLATGTREEMEAAFRRQVEALGLRVKTTHGINYGVFAEPSFTTPPVLLRKDGQPRRRQPKPEMIFQSVEGFFVVAPSRIEEKVVGRYGAFEERFRKVARLRKITLPPLPGRARAKRLDAEAAERKRAAISPKTAARQQGDLFRDACDALAA